MDTYTLIGSGIISILSATSFNFLKKSRDYKARLDVYKNIDYPFCSQHPVFEIDPYTFFEAKFSAENLLKGLAYREFMPLDEAEWPKGADDVELIRRLGGEEWLITPEYMYFLMNFYDNTRLIPDNCPDITVTSFTDGSIYLCPVTPRTLPHETLPRETRLVCFRAPFDKHIAKSVRNTLCKLQDIVDPWFGFNYEIMCAHRTMDINLKSLRYMLK